MRNVNLVLPTDLGPDFELQSGQFSVQKKLREMEARNLKLMASKSGQLTNGFGLMGDNTNFSSMKFDSTDMQAGFGSFYSDRLNGDHMIDELLQVNPAMSARFSLYAKTKTKVGTSNAYFYVACLDCDANPINPTNLPILSFRLGKALTVGGTVHIHPDDVAKVRSVLGARLNASGHLYLVTHEYTSKGGFVFPNGKYTRLFYSRAVSANATRLSDNGEWTGFNIFSLNNRTLTEGSMVSLALPGGTYTYPIPDLTGRPIPEEWTAYSGTLGPSDGSIHANKWRPFTALAKIGFLTNRESQTGNIQSFSSLYFQADFA